LVTKEKIELIEEPKFLKYNKENTFLKDDSDYYEKPDFEKIVNKLEGQENDIDHIIDKYSKGKCLFIVKLNFIPIQPHKTFF